LDLRLTYFVGTRRFNSSSKCWTTTICGTAVPSPPGRLEHHKPLVIGRDVVVSGELVIQLTQVPPYVFGGVEDYPRTLVEFEAQFATEEPCLAYLCQLRRPEGFRCPRCSASKA